MTTLTRLLTEPHAVLREAGIKIPEGTTPNTIVVGPGAGATPTSIVVVAHRDLEGNVSWGSLVVVNGSVVGEVSGPVQFK